MQPDGPDAKATKPAGCLAGLQTAFAILAGAFCLLVAACYALRPPAMVAATIFPVWSWLLPGLALVVLSYSRKHWRRTLLLVGAWMAVMLIFAEEPWALVTRFRQWPDAAWYQAKARGDGLRVVSANCAGGNADVVREALAYEPDVLLLQESPTEPALAEAVAEHLNYRFFWGPDCSIAVHGEARRVAPPMGRRTAVTIVDADIGRHTIRVIDTHVLLPYCGTDLWRPDAWRSAREAHRSRARQMAELTACMGSTPEGRPLIVGGDFNTPAGDDLFRALKPRLRDSFRDRSIGFGNTIVNDCPLSRIDQIWVSRDLRVYAVVTRRTQHSDHRLVIADLAVQ
jgi:endonuclease/exonuclease/phosphatase (EEP) superfamily protein YafD